MGCRDASHCILGVRTRWASSVATTRGSALGADVQLCSTQMSAEALGDFLNLTQTPVPSLVGASNPSPYFRECPQCMSSHLAQPPCPLFGVCYSVLPHIGSRSKAKFLPWSSQKSPCTQAFVNLVTLLKMKGHGEESHHGLGSLFFFLPPPISLCHPHDPWETRSLFPPVFLRTVLPHSGSFCAIQGNTCHSLKGILLDKISLSIVSTMPLQEAGKCGVLFCFVF